FSKIAKRAEKAAENAILKKTDEKVTKETDKVMDGVLNEGEDSESAGQDTSSDSQASTSDTGDSEVKASGAAKTWSKYNFVPGEVIIFEDDLSREENGEFPSRWDLVTGNAENALLGDTKVITLEHGSIITPLINKDDYLPEVFTLEFDAYFNDTYSHWQEYDIRFYPGDNSYAEIGEDLYSYPLRINKNGASIQTRVNNESKSFEKQGNTNPDGYAGWKHIAISYNQRALKV